MKHLLLIANHYFNKENIASNRTSGIIKYLPEFGWEITLITFDPSYKEYINNEFIRIGNRNIAITCKKIINIDANQTINLNSKTDNPDSGDYSNKSGSIIELLRYIYMQINRSTFFDNQIFYSIKDLTTSLFLMLSTDKRWARVVFSLEKENCKRGIYDAVLSTYGIEGSHIVASKLSKKYNVPFVADYRDYWSQDPYYTYSTWKKKMMMKNEIKTIEPAVHITAVSKPMADDLSGLHNKPVSVISNGYDPETVNPGIPLRQKFTITYLGSLYNGKRDPEPLLIVIDELISEGRIEKERISIDFYGPHDNQLESKIIQYNLQDCVIQHGMVSKEESIHLQWSSQILLLLTWTHPSEVGICPGKVFEYLAAKRPILSMGYKGKCVISDILDETQAGIHNISDDYLKKQILVWYNEYLETGEVSYHGIDEKIDQYSQRGMAKKFADVLDMVIKQHIIDETE